MRLFIWDVYTYQIWKMCKVMCPINDRIGIRFEICPYKDKHPLAYLPVIYRISDNKSTLGSWFLRLSGAERIRSLFLRKDDYQKSLLQLPFQNHIY
jgi:hypothetical protein